MKYKVGDKVKVKVNTAKPGIVIGKGGNLVELLKKELLKKDIKDQYELLIVKNKIRKHFENAIRKSIHRYIPANTVLWQIKFSGK